jgi:O-antigen/teichoic acid export membrane protein
MAKTAYGDAIQSKGDSVFDHNDSKTTSIRLNTLTNYIGQGYTIAIAIVVTPFYLQYLGAEAYGLVGFFMVMQNWLNLLDMGLSTTLGRQVAYARGRKNGFAKFQNLLKSFELIFSLLALSIVACVYFGADWISHSWIKSSEINSDNVSYCVVIMGLIIGLRFFSTIYRSGINGFEDQVWINKTSIVVNSLKYIGSFLILIYVSKDVKNFFQYQLLIGGLEAVFLGKRFYYNLPSFDMPLEWHKIDWSVFLEILPFTLSVTYTSAVLLVITQFDKLLLSGILSLEEFGYFSLITLMAGSIISLSTPVFLAFLPRMTVLASKNSVREMVAIYVKMTQITTWITFSAALLISIYSQEIFYSLTGDKRAYEWGREMLVWYTLGSSIYVLGTFQYYLQNAFGKLRLYVVGLTISFLVQTPLIYFVTINYGALGASRLWFAFSTIWFLGWTLVVHSRLLPGFHFRWLTRDLLPILLFTSALSYLMIKMIHIDMNQSRMLVMIKTGLVGIVFLVITSTSVRSIRNKYLNTQEI